MTVLDELNKFYNEFNGEKGVFGKSEKGKDLFYFKVKKTERPVILIQYSIHAREYITCYLALKQIEDYILRGKLGTVYFLPCVNVDGVEICIKEKPLYKANANGVDLNVNFDARWGTGKSNVTKRGDENFIGEFPISESESKSLVEFTYRISPDATVSYHSKGEEIYWEFFQTEKDAKRDYLIAKKISEFSGYSIKRTPDSAGGYKDWCINKLHIPSFTIEVGSDSLSHPIGKEHLGEIFNKNKEVIKVLTESVWNLNS